MFKVFKESFYITNKYFIYLATPLVIFSFLSSLYLVFSANGNRIGLMISVCLFLLMMAAFIAGWLYMVSNCIKKIDLDDKLSLIKEFPSGVGEYFLSAIGMIFNILLISVILYFVAHLVGNHYIGDIGITSEALRNAQTSPEAAKQLYDSLSPEQIAKVMQWGGLSFLVTTVSAFIFMFYSPAIIYKTKNPFKAFVTSLKDTFSRNLLKNLALFIIVYFTYVVLAIVSGIFGFNLFFQFIINLLNFYYIVFVMVYIYNHYYSNFVKIGSNVDVNV